jgi:hypothetical protein
MADIEAFAFAQIRFAFQKQNALNQRTRMLAFVLRLVQRFLGQSIQTHVRVHLSMNQVLVNGRQLSRE